MVGGGVRALLAGFGVINGGMGVIVGLLGLFKLFWGLFIGLYVKRHAR